MAAAKTPRTSIDALHQDRPRFPEGLRVLLAEPNGSTSDAFSLLQDLKYEVMAVTDLEGALTALQRSSAPSAAHSYDVVLADATLLGPQQQQLFCASGSVPVVLMGEQCSPAQVVQAVEHGAADFLERPLSQLKLRNLWQHTVRAMMSFGSCQSSPKAAPASAAATPASTSPLRHLSKEQQQQSEQQHPLAGQTSTELHECHLALAGDCCDVTPSPDCLDGLALPPLVPAQLTFDPDSIFLDLDCPVADHEPSLDDILQPCTPPEDSAAATADLELLGGYSSDQHGCSSGATVFQSSKFELESCADTMSCVPGLPSPAGNSSSVGLARCSHVKSCRTEDQLACSTAGPAAATGTAGRTAGWPVTPPFNSGHFWGMPSIPQGMVWGMPILNVATVPGIVVTPAKDTAAGTEQQPGNSSKSSSAAAAAGAAVPAGASQTLTPTMFWPMMSMIMPNAQAGAAAAGCMPYPSLPYPAMFPPMGGYMGAMGCMPMGMPMGTPASWPAGAATGAVSAAGAAAIGASTAAPAPAAPTGSAAATTAAVVPGVDGQACAAPLQGCDTSSYKEPTTDVASMCRSGSMASSSKSACSSVLCTDSLFGPGPADRLVC